MSNPNLLSTPAVRSASGSSQPASASETPLKKNMSSTNVFINGSLDDQRKAVRDDLGPIPEVTVDFMLNHIIPNSNVDVKSTMEALERDGIWSQNAGWKQFEELSPKQLATKNKDVKNNIETHIFRRIKDVYDSIISSTQFINQSNRNPTLYFEQWPNSAPVSDTKVKTRPDCCGVLKPDQTIHSSHEINKSKTPRTSSKIDQHVKSKDEGLAESSSDRPNWFDIAWVEEYKLNDKIEDLNDDVVKILWSLHHIMHIDHRRRFTFGLTIENEDARIWFSCRQIVLVTRSFNFRTSAVQLVQLIASLAYATPAQLGYDPTMTLRRRNEDWHYDIELTTKRPGKSDRKLVYKTSKVLSNTAHNLRGRATRVYLATVDDDPDDPFVARSVVLKDSWIDADRPKEGDTLAQLLEGASDEERALFLTTYQHGVVQIDNQDDSTQGLILNGHVIELPSNNPGGTEPRQVNRFNRFEALGIIQETPESAPPPETDGHIEARLFHLYTYTENVPKKRSSTSRTSHSASLSTPKSESRNSDALTHNTHHKYDKPIVYSPKVHYRIAFLEIGESLLQIAGSARATTRILDRALCDITKALHYMAKKGYVHRDVSAGNIIWWKDHAKLSDLEFAKHYGTGASSYVRTGTYSFMAGEVMKGKYSVKKFTSRNATASFVHNPIHDLESLWWVGVWCLMWHYPAPFTKAEITLISDTTTPNSQPAIQYEYRVFNDKELAHIKAVRQDGEKLFPSFHDWADNIRMEEIHDPYRYLSRGDDGYPDAVAAMIFGLDNMRQCISWAYMTIQRNLPRSDPSYFTNVLRVANPLRTFTEPEEEDVDDSENDIRNGVKIPVHDRILQMLEEIKGKADLEDAILWPLESIEHYNRWLKATKTITLKAKTRQHLSHGFINVDP